MSIETAIELEHIRTESRPNCIFCGSHGTAIHRQQQDRLFGAAGWWDLKQCPSGGCGLVWLDPMPLEEDIGKAYSSYYTHTAQPISTRKGWLKQARALMVRSYQASRYGYDAPQTLCSRLLGAALYLRPIRRREAEADVRCLSAIPRGGRLLDVGCGSGEWMLSMQARGWKVEGLDFDENAVAAARSFGLKVECGSLEQQSYPDASFDAVTLNHVIEHLPDPVKTLRECVRILKPGGKLVLFTPNNGSLGHKVFKQDWRGLEPPRHLHIFSLPSMHKALVAAGLRNVSVQPFIVTSIIYESLLLRAGSSAFRNRSSRNWSARGITVVFKFVELCLLKWNASLGDCIIGIGVKQSRE